MAISDPFSMPPSDGVAPAIDAAAVTKSDTTVVNCRSFYVGTAGDVAIYPLHGSAAVTLKNCVAGQVYAIACKKIMSANTSASDIVALY